MVIVQISDVVHFQGAARIVVPLQEPSTAGTVLALAVVMRGSAPALRVSDDLAGSHRWRQANRDGCRAFWYRHQSPEPGVVEVIIDTPNALEITGRAVVAEAAGVSAGTAVQLLSDLLLEASVQ